MSLDCGFVSYEVAKVLVIFKIIDAFVFYVSGSTHEPEFS